MNRVVRVTVLAVVAFCSAALSGCSSNPSGVHLQDPPPRATSTPAVASTASAPSVGQSPTTAISAGHPTPPAPVGPSGAKSTAPSPAPSSTATASTPAATPTSSLTPADPEAANREAIEAVWAKYWIDGLRLLKVPASDRLSVMKTVAIPSVAANVVSAAAKEEAAGQAGYGVVVHRPYWATPVGGKSTAVMNDCMNDYNAGTLDVKTGKPLRAGVYRDNLRATFAKGVDGLWRVAKIEYLANVSC